MPDSLEFFDAIVGQFAAAASSVDLARPPYSISGQAFQAWYMTAQRSLVPHQVPQLELDWYVQALTRLNRLQLRLGVATQSQVELAIPWPEVQARWVQRLGDRTPVQYLVGWSMWRHFLLQVSPAVLIPRPETELVIDLAQAAIAANPALLRADWADVGTGSGAIALGLADLLHRQQRHPSDSTDSIPLTVHGIDLSPAALAIAQANAHLYPLIPESNIPSAEIPSAGIPSSKPNPPGITLQFHLGDLLSPLQPNSLAAVISNPPYIPTAVVEGLDPEVRHHEPHLALDGGADGLDLVRRLIAQAPDYLQPGGLWLVEVMVDQAPLVSQALAADGRYGAIACHRDLAGIERFVQAYRLEKTDSVNSTD